MSVINQTMAHEPEFHTKADYACYIHLYNKTNVDFQLTRNYKAFHGHWAKGSPPNLVKAGTETLIQLDDVWGFSGSKGEVTYMLYLPKKSKSPVTFKLEFSDPFGGWYDNKLTARSSDPKLVSCHVLHVQPEGHPFTGHVEIHEANVALASDGDANLRPGVNAEQRKTVSNAPRNVSDGKLRAAYDLGFDGGPPSFHKDPVHEDMAISAFIASDLHFPEGTDYNNLDPDQWEFIRGLIWNDDPSCLLFKDAEDSNSDYGRGFDFFTAFEFGSSTCMTQRSHFGDLQFLHGMASGHGEDPNITKGRAMVWLEVMYKLAIEQFHENDRLDQRFPKYFHNHSQPNGGKSLRDLLLGGTTAYPWAEIPKRALGSCLHLIQDSYAVGHTLRRLRNPQDLNRRDEKSFAQFKYGTYAQLGPIITFHTYAGQSNRHEHYDRSWQSREPWCLDTFNDIIGGRVAIEKCIKFINFYASKTRWEDGVASFLTNEVLALDKHCTPSNADVDERFALPDTCGPESLVSLGNNNTDEEWQTGLVKKLASLERGLTHDHGCHETTPSILQRAIRGLRPALKGVLPIFALSLAALLTYLTVAVLGLSRM